MSACAIASRTVAAVATGPSSVATLCMGLVLRCKHDWFAATDQMLRQGAAEMANADDGRRHGFEKSTI